MNIKWYVFCGMSVLMISMQSCEAARADNIANKTIRKSFFCLAASLCCVKSLAHAAMARFYFKQSCVPGLHENAKKDYYEVVQPPHLWREWATASWGRAVEYPSYTWHACASGMWLCAAAGMLYVVRY